jgi:hypothetical protein
MSVSVRSGPVRSKQRGFEGAVSLTALSLAASEPERPFRRDWLTREDIIRTRIILSPNAGGGAIVGRGHRRWSSAIAKGTRRQSALRCAHGRQRRYASSRTAACGLRLLIPSSEVIKSPCEYAPLCKRNVPAVQHSLRGLSHDAAVLLDWTRLRRWHSRREARRRRSQGTCPAPALRGGPNSIQGYSNEYPLFLAKEF